LGHCLGSGDALLVNCSGWNCEHRPERVRDVKSAERFAREAPALAALNHPNMVTIYDFGQAGGFYFLLMEFVDGVTPTSRSSCRSRALEDMVLWK